MEENQQLPENEIAASNDQQTAPVNQQPVKTAGKIPWGILIPLVLVVMGMISWLIFSRKITLPGRTEENLANELQETPQTSESAIEEFKAYSNEKQKFQFTYPRTLKFEQLIVFSDEPTHYRVVYTGGLQKDLVEREEDLVDGYIFRVAVYDNIITPIADLAEMKRERFIRDCPESTEVSQKAGIDVHGEKGLIFSVDNCKQNYIEYFVNYYGKVYEIVQVYKGDVGFKLSYKGRLEDIMNTFKFIRDQAPIDPDGLEAYTNAPYGFSFRHPKLNADCCTISGPAGAGIAHLVTMAEGSKDFKGKVNGIAVFVDENKAAIDFEDYVKIQKEKLVQEYRVIMSRNPKPVEEEITLDGQKAYLLRGYAWWGDVVFAPLGTKAKILIITKSELIEGGFEDSFSKILATFKYLSKE